jgi:hypothetical protein
LKEEGVISEDELEQALAATQKELKGNGSG